MTLPAYQGKWRRIRAAVLARDGGVCQVRGPGCTGVATEVDHIVEVLAGGAWWDPSNLRASCHTCNQSRRNARMSQRWQSAPTRITVVVGTSDDALRYVRTNAQANDLVVDLASLARTLGGYPAATAARNALLDRLRRGAVPTVRAWITTGDPAEVATLPHHAVVELGGGSEPGGYGENVVQSTRIALSATAPAAARASRAW